jgi:Insect cuticle protein
LHFIPNSSLIYSQAIVSFQIKMNSFTMIFGLALIAIASAHGGASSYVKRTDDHGHHTEVSHGGHHGGGGGGDDSHGHGGDSHGHGGDSHHDYYHHPSYKYEYGVKDPKTKDHHSQWEHRDGDVVKGEYTLDEADGTKRVVSYTSDKKSGFNAVVKNIGHAHHPHGHHEHGHH